jgi:formylglycine-generating enzyme required for sulfatase activity
MPKKFLILLFVISQGVFSQKIKKNKTETLKLNGKKTPYVYIGLTNVYASKYELSNYDYLCFLNWIRKTKGENEYRQNLPDTNVWRSNLVSSEKYVDYYLRHPAYRNHPVVGVTYEQVLNYLNYLTLTTNEKLQDKRIKKIHFRLPTEEEWETAARGGLAECTIYPWGTSRVVHEKGKHKGIPLANFMRNSGDLIHSLGMLNDGFDFTGDRHYYSPNRIGLYNMAGNIAEMILEKSICKGGSWNKESHKMVISTRDTFDVAASWVGFRVFAEIEEYQVLKSQRKVDAKFIEGNMSYIPAGAVHVPGYYPLFEPDSSDTNESEEVIILSNFYISKYEVSNAFYLQFLNSLIDTIKRNEYMPKDENWKYETDNLQYQHYTYQFPNHPVVNITKEAMIAFCAWLEEQYNNDLKRKYAHVEISLPTAKQQLRVMTCDSHFFTYSWGGPYCTDEQGEYLMNFNPLFDHELYNEEKLTSDLAYRKDQMPLLKKSRALDGYELTAPVGSYKYSNFGLCNEHGNVAEVVSNSDFVIGGSFASMNGNCTNEIFFSYNINVLPEKIFLPSPQVGFRFVMTGMNQLLDEN